MDTTTVSRGLALAEREIMRFAERDGDTAEAIEATIVTTAAQRKAALAPRPTPENESPRAKIRRNLMMDMHRRRNSGDEDELSLDFTSSERDDYMRRMDKHTQLMRKLTKENEQKVRDTLKRAREIQQEHREEKRRIVAAAASNASDDDASLECKPKKRPKKAPPAGAEVIDID